VKERADLSSVMAGLVPAIHALMKEK